MIRETRELIPGFDMSPISEDAKLDVIGIRRGEKIHEQMIGEEDAMYTFEYDDHY